MIAGRFHLLVGFRGMITPQTLRSHLSAKWRFAALDADGAFALPRIFCASAITAILLLSGCATQEHYIATSCVKDVPTRPQIHSNADLIAASPADRYKGIAADRFRLLDYSAQLEALLDACR